MAEAILRLDVDPETGKKNITIKLTSDPDSLPVEHEEDHRRLVDQLIEGGALRAAEVGKITVERIDNEQEGNPVSSDEPVSERQAVKVGE